MKGTGLRINILVPLIFISAMTASNSLAYTTMGKVSTLEKSEHNITFNCANGKDGLPMFVKAGAILPMIPEMSYIYEKAPDPLTLDIFLFKGGGSSYVMLDCDSVKPPVNVRQTNFTCKEERGKIEISISPSATSYELWVYSDSEPGSVTADGAAINKVGGKDDYDKTSQGWYYGTGSFYGYQSIKTVNIKVPKSVKEHIILIKM